MRKREHGAEGLSLIEVLIVLALLVVLLGPMLHIYILTSRGMRNSEDELIATRLCLRVIEGFQSLPLETIPQSYAKGPVSGMPQKVVTALGWTDPADYSVTVAISTVQVDKDDASLDAVAPDPNDPRRLRLEREATLRSITVECSRSLVGGSGSRSIKMGALVGWSR